MSSSGARLRARLSYPGPARLDRAARGTGVEGARRGCRVGYQGYPTAYIRTIPAGYAAARRVHACDLRPESQLESRRGQRDAPRAPSIEASPQSRGLFACVLSWVEILSSPQSLRPVRERERPSPTPRGTRARRPARPGPRARRKPSLSKAKRSNLRFEPLRYRRAEAGASARPRAHG